VLLINDEVADDIAGQSFIALQSGWWTTLGSKQTVDGIRVSNCTLNRASIVLVDIAEVATIKNAMLEGIGNNPHL